MMPPAKQMDPVMGVDIHMIQPPGPVPPVPIPHPFIGMVIDPMEFAPIIGATVMVHGMPAAIAGVECKCIPPHIPMGGVFVPPAPLPGSEGELFMGSATVQFDGDAASHLMHPVLSCQSVGMPQPPRMNPKKKPKIRTDLFLPTTFVMPIPGAPPVFIGGPPTISLMSLGMKAGMAALGGLFKKYKKWAKGSERMKNISKKIHKKADDLMDKMKVPKNARNKVHKGICSVTGHPVDVCSGKVFTDHVDFELPGPIPLKWERTWFSTSIYDGPLGHGWHHSYDLKLSERLGAVAVILEDGRPVAFPALDEGQESFNRQERMTLFKDDQGYGMRHVSGITYRFMPRDGDNRNQLLSSTTDRASGRSILFFYDAMGHLKEITDSAGRQIEIVCNRYGQIEQILLPHPTEEGKQFCAVRYFYDRQGDLVEVRDALDNPFRYRYDNHLLVQETNRNGLSFYFEYDGRDHNARCVHTWGDGGIYDHKLTYDLDNNITVVENSLGHKTTYYHDGVLPHRIVDALGNETSVEYDEDYLLLKEVDELGVATEYEYDERGNQIRWIGPDGNVIQSQFDEKDLPCRAIDPSGNEWHRMYDEFGCLVARLDPLERRFEYNYLGGDLRELKDTAGNVYDLRYDTHSNLKSIALPDGTSHSWKYDRLGNVIRCIDPKGNSQQLEYDRLNRIVRVNEPDGNIRVISYDKEGNVVGVKDKYRDVVFSYQGMHRIASRTEKGRQVRFSYDTEDQLISIQNENSQIYSFELDALGNVKSESGFDGLINRYIREPNGRIRRVEKANSSSKEYFYSITGKVMKIVYADGSEETFEYNKNGELVGATNQSIDIRFERDALGRVVREYQGKHWVASEFDDLGYRVKMISSMGAEQVNKRSSLGDVVSVQYDQKKQTEVNFKRDELGREIERSLPGGLRSVWKRDKLGRPIQNDVGTNTLRLSSRTYSWDVDDRLLEIKDALNGSTVYHRDALGNLIGATYDNGWVEHRLPDAVGNIFKNKDCTDRKYGPAGQLLESTDKRGKTFYKYSEEGNLIRKIEPNGKVWQYLWNASGMLSCVIRPDQERVEFVYDALGRRIQKRFKNKITHWLWDGNNPLHEWNVLTKDVDEPDGDVNGSLKAAPEVASKKLKDLQTVKQSGAPPPHDSKENTDHLITWLFEPDTFSPMAKIEGDNHYSIVTDHLGTPRLMLDESGREVWSAELSIVGKLRNLNFEGKKKACPFRWPGQYEDEETGLYYNRFRYYDPDAGQYMSQDPVGLLGNNPSIYAYAADPLTWFDVFGLAIIPDKVLGPDSRVESATADVTKDDLGTGTNTNSSSRKHARNLGNQNDDAGHMIGKQLGGSGGKKNVFPQSFNKNRGEFAQFEGRVAELVRDKGSAKITLEFEYEDGGTRPTKVRYTAEAPDGTKLTKNFDNPCH